MTSDHHPLDLAARAELLGISMRDLIALATRDRRISLSLVAPATFDHTKRWLVGGSPSSGADLDLLEFAGSDEVRAIVVDVVPRLPAPVAHHVVHNVAIVEVGRSAHGWHGLGMQPRAQTIALCGASVDDGGLAGVLGHEIGHAWVAPVCSIVPRRVPRAEAVARSLVAERVVADVRGGDAIERLVRARVAAEIQADQLATIWGWPRTTDVPALMWRFRAEVAATAARADEIEAAIDDEIRNAG